MCVFPYSMVLLFVVALVLESLIFDIFLYLSFQTRPCNIRCQIHLQNSIENLFGNSDTCVGKNTHIKTRDSNNNIKKIASEMEVAPRYNC